METTFTPIASLSGGVLIGIAAVLLMFLRGRIMGATGILAGALIQSDHHERFWRIMMLLGMLAGPWVYYLFAGSLPDIRVPPSFGLIVIGGFLVGIGVTLGNGCTSGHGVCGVARLSPRSVAATATFMVTTFATVYVIRHLAGG